MTLLGKGFYTWKIQSCENGNPGAIASTARSAGLGTVLIKVANGIYSYNVDQAGGVDYAAQLAQALKSQGIQSWGWHYVYGNDPVAEANKAIQRIHQLGLDGYIIDAESEYKQPGKREAAKKFMAQLRLSLPTFPIALSSYRYPSYHPDFPWREFLDRCDYNMPQVYWMQAHNAGDQLRQSARQFQAMTPYRPIIPTGAAFRESGWQPAAAEVLDFLNTAMSLNLIGVNFWEWSDARSGIMPGVWETIRDYSWGGNGKDICVKYMEGLNSRDPQKLIPLYASTAVHVTSTRTVQGIEAITTWFKTLFTQILPNAAFTLTGFSGTGSSRHFTWTAASGQGRVQNGNDTFGLVNDKIAYHYCFFTVAP
ncbi:MAG: nuclear transport factor 2 family protein [Omnitrophica WOR_2 bacterium]